MPLLRALFCLSVHLAVLSAPAPIRFLLSFDDGPSLWDSTPTTRILEQLAENPVTPSIKALFFVQSAHIEHGGSEAGRAIMRRACGAGHLLGVHSASARGHIPHPRLDDGELAASMRDGREAIAAQCGEDAGLVRPPDWEYDGRTLAAYQAAGLGMLLSDLSANDGKIYGWNLSLRRRAHLRRELADAAQAYQAGLLPVWEGVTPVVMTFHDTNPYTADHMREYLHILVEEATALSLPLADPPFYTDTAALLRAAQGRAQAGRFVCGAVSRSAGWRARWTGDQAELRKGCFQASPR
ncbi:polysaccharide deacetylase family protein [Chitinimonas arctica]|nr:polysaccharide deacetylase family protein [Chitinimonas arctica]